LGFDFVARRLFDADCADAPAAWDRFCRLELGALLFIDGCCVAETMFDLDEFEAADNTRSHSLAVDLRANDATPVRPHGH
jgi:hypothetical protein